MNLNDLFPKDDTDPQNNDKNHQRYENRLKRFANPFQFWYEKTAQAGIYQRQIRLLEQFVLKDRKEAVKDGSIINYMKRAFNESLEILERAQDPQVKQEPWKTDLIIKYLDGVDDVIKKHLNNLKNIYDEELQKQHDWRGALKCDHTKAEMLELVKEVRPLDEELFKQIKTRVPNQITLTMEGQNYEQDNNVVVDRILNMIQGKVETTKMDVRQFYADQSGPSLLEQLRDLLQKLL